MSAKTIAPVGEWLDEAQRLAAERGDHAIPEVVLGVAIRRLGAVGGAIWHSAAGNGLTVLVQEGVGNERIDQFHQRWPGHQQLLEQVRGSGQPQLVSARLDRNMAGGSTGAGSSVPLALLIAPYRQAANGEQDVLELFVAGRMDGAASQESLQALDEYCREARRLDAASVERTPAPGAAPPAMVEAPPPQSQDLSGFAALCAAVHAGLDVNVTATAIANQVRAWLACDRVSVLQRRGRRCRLLAVSDVDEPDRRSAAVRSLEELARESLRAGQPLWRDRRAAAAGAGELPGPDGGAWFSAAIPLFPASAARGRPVGVLIVEHFRETDGWTHQRRTQLELAAAQSALAFDNALRYETVPFSRLGRGLQRLGWRSAGTRVLKWMTALVLLSAIVAALVLVEGDFDITGRGTLLPSEQRDIFARVDGIVDELLVEHGQSVAAGAPLLRLRSPELARTRAELEGERRTTEQQIADLSALRGGRESRNEARPLSQAELAARQAELTAVLESLNEQLAALARHEAELTVRTPIDGSVLTWDVEQLLAGRPVQAGQRLLTIADVNGPWIVEVRVPDRDIGHVHEARQHAAALPVTFLAATDLETRRSGSVREVSGVVEHDPLEGSVVVVTVDVAPDQDFERRRGATVYPRIHCGRRPLGYVWFRRAYETAAAWLALW